MARSLNSLFAVSLLLAATPASSQDYRTYETVVHAAKYKADWKSFYIWANAQTQAARASTRHKLDLAYGRDPKQKLDLYFPKSPKAGAPVLLFLHGGGFQEGDRAHYGYIAPAYTKRGVIVAVASYRLTVGGFQYPAPEDDARMAITWLYKHIAALGGNPDHIVLAGHSAGAIIAAQIGADRRWMAAAGVPERALRAIVPVSAGYDFVGDAKRDYFLPTPEAKDAASAVRHVTDPVPLAIVAVGGAEQPIQAPSQALRDALAAKGSKAELVVVPGADHQGTVKALGDPSSQLYRDVLAALN